MNLSSEFVERYHDYLQNNCPDLDSDSLSRVASSLESTCWDDPTSAIDLNNFAVVALIEAEQTQDSSLRELYIGMALQALNQGLEEYRHPLCAAHLAIFLTMTGDREEAIEIIFPTFIDTIQYVYTNIEKNTPGIVYLPRTSSSFKNTQNEELIRILQAEDGYTQSLLLLTETLCRTQLVFYNAMGLRLLHLAAQVFPDSISINFKLGISSLMNNQWEGLLYLHRVHKKAPEYAPILQVIYLAYKKLEQIERANSWLEVARKLERQSPNSLEWRWTDLELDSPFTYIPFESELLVAVEPSFRSLVTGVLIAEGDWFEKEMELWRSWIEPGMIVIDVGANVGVYTFSAARRVGPKGRVLAVEPFSGCVRCLQETCRINQLDWVKVCVGAASDREGTVRLSLSTASELNEVVSGDAAEKMKPGSFEEVSCFPLDSLIEAENLSQVDFIKIDAEGHELSVLAGSERILSEFAPVILYENIAGSKSSNLPVADHLKNRGYQLFRYQPYLQKLIPLNSDEDLQGNLNIIALPPNQTFRVS